MALEIIWHSPAYDPSGYASCARDYILSLDRAGFKVRFEPISFFSPITTPAISGETFKRLRELESTPVSHNCVHVTHMVPDLYHKRDDKHIPVGYTVFETDSIPKQWVDKMNLMKSIWVPCSMNFDTFAKGGFDKSKMRLVPHIVQTERLDPSKYEPLDIPIKKDFYFLTIMDVTHRKGWDVLLRAYFREFQNNKDVGLIFKGYFGGVSDNQKRNLIQRIRNFRDSLNIKNPPDIIFFGDIIDNDNLPRLYKSVHCYVLPHRGEGWCTVPDAKIITPNGIKNIVDITKGEYVLSHTGNFRKVNKLLTRQYNGELISIRTYYNNKKLKLTPNHKILTAKYKRVNKKETMFDVNWKESNELTINDHVAFPKNIFSQNVSTKINLQSYFDGYNIKIVDEKIYNTKGDKIHHYSKPINQYITIDEYWSKLFGYFISEGCAHTGKGSVSLCLNQKSTDDNIRNFFIKNFPKAYIYNSDRHRQTITINYRTLSIFLKAFGKNAGDKHLPPELFNIYLCNKDLSKILLSALWEGDGCFTCNTAFQYTTVSENLAYQIKTLLINLGIYPTLKESNRLCYFNNKFSKSYDIIVKGKNNIKLMNSILNRNEIIQSVLNRSNKKEDDNYIWLPILRLEKENYNGIVYNMSIDTDETYVCDFVIVHNCLTASEAMSMELPTISTSKSGNEQFMNNDNSYLIDIIGHRDTSEEMLKITPNYQNQKFVEPSEAHLRQLMRHVYENYGEAKKKGIKARQDLINEFSWEPITNKIKECVEELQR